MKKIAILKWEIDDSRDTTVENLLKFYGINYTIINKEDIEKGIPEDLDILISVGGEGKSPSYDLLKKNQRRIEEFIQNGGGFIGIEEGSYVVLELCTNKSSIKDRNMIEMIFPLEENTSIANVQIGLLNAGHPIFENYERTITIKFTNNPLFVVKENSSHQKDILAIYENKICTSSMENTSILAAIIASEYEKGRYVLFSFNPLKTPGLERLFLQALAWCANHRISKYSFLPQNIKMLQRKGVWLWANTVYNLGEKAAKIITEQLKEYEFTDIFLLLKGGKGRAYYNSKIAISKEYPERDILMEVIKEAHKRNIKVHGWFCINTDSEWLKIYPEDKMGCIKPDPNIAKLQMGPQRILLPPAQQVSIEGDRVSLLSPRYKEYIGRMIEEIVRNYEIDGIHIDYIRYPHAIFGFSENYEIKEAKRLGINVEKISKIIRETFYDSSSDHKDIFEKYEEGDLDVIKWINLRRSAVRHFSEELKNYVKMISKEIEFSSALMPEGAYKASFLLSLNDSQTYALVHYGQSYEDALAIYDWIVPMLYWADFNKSPQWVAALYENARWWASKTNKKVYAGVQAYSPVTTEELFNAVTFNEKYDGVVLFRYGSFGFSKINIMPVGRKLLAVNVLVENPIDTNCSENACINKIVVDMGDDLSVKSVILEEDKNFIVTLKNNRKIISIEGNPTFSQCQKIKISALIEKEKEENHLISFVKVPIVKLYAKTEKGEDKEFPVWMMLNIQHSKIYTLS